VKSSSTLKVAALGLILAVTISIKAVGLRPDRPSDEKLNEAIVALLSRAHFAVEQNALVSGVEIVGRAPDCRIAVRDAFPQGYNLEAIATWAKDAQLHYAFRGELFEQPPTYRATAAFVWARALRQFGLHPAWSPLLAIASTGTCALNTLAWGGLNAE
jgi:hypothetical protein